jgi:hypothetical protein
MGGFADDKNTESVIIVFFFPFFLPANFGKKKSDKIIRLNLQIDVVWTSSLLR